jgi:hypothetical protein
MFYNIGGLWIHLNGLNDYFSSRSISFMKQPGKDIKPGTCDMQILIELYEKIKIPDGKKIHIGDDTVMLKKTPPEQGYYIYLENYEENRKNSNKVALMDINDTWSFIKLIYEKTNQMFIPINSEVMVSWVQYHSFLSMGVAYRNLLIRKNGLQIHSSSIEFEGKGLIFSAASGTGKSTHTRLWKKLYGNKVSIVNDDRPAVRYINNIPMLCGTPWSGSSDNFTNQIVPLNCIVMLEQSTYNSIEEVKVSKALQLLMPRCFMPYYDKNMMNEAMNTLEKLISDVPVYHLKCLPEYKAVELVMKCIN